MVIFPCQEESGKLSFLFIITEEYQKLQCVSSVISENVYTVNPKLTYGILSKSGKECSRGPQDSEKSQWCFWFAF